MEATKPSRRFVSGIILAAGTSSRLGRPKQLLELAGKPVLAHVVEALRSAPVDEIVVVLGHRAADVAAALSPTGGVRIAVNPDYSSGQSSSFRLGLRSVDARSEAALILLGDQPGIRTESIAAVIDAWRREGAAAVQVTYSGTPGHPILFDRSLWPELERAEGDEGARGILAAHPQWRSLVEVDGTPPPDIDTEADYAAARAAFGDP